MTPEQIDDPKYRSGAVCVAPGCTLPAGTFFTRWYCPACDAQRRVATEAEIAQARATFEARRGAAGTA